SVLQVNNPASGDVIASFARKDWSKVTADLNHSFIFSA
nr:succinate-semialdehyde dehydrogenase, mitochondrial [Tanacetum cinerariifolium]